MQNKNKMERVLLIQNIIDFGNENIEKINDKFGSNKFIQTEESPRRNEFDDGGRKKYQS